MLQRSIRWTKFLLKKNGYFGCSILSISQSSFYRTPYICCFGRLRQFGRYSQLVVAAYGADEAVDVMKSESLTAHRLMLLRKGRAATASRSTDK